MARSALDSLPEVIDPADILSAREAADLAGVTFSHMRVLQARGQFPAPFRTEPQLWLREDVFIWKSGREKP